MADFIASVARDLEELQHNLSSQHSRIVERLRTEHQQLMGQDGVAGARDTGHWDSDQQTSLAVRVFLAGHPPVLSQEWSETIFDADTALSVQEADADTIGFSHASQGAKASASLQSSTRGVRVICPSRISEVEMESQQDTSDSEMPPLFTHTSTRLTLRSNTSRLKFIPRQEWDLNTELAHRALQDDDGVETQKARDEIELECLCMLQMVRGIDIGMTMASSFNGMHVTGSMLVRSRDLSPESSHASWWPRPPFSPHSTRRFLWDMLGMALVLYEMLTIPVLLLVLPLTDTFSPAVDIVGGLYWSTDILLSFLTCVEIDGQLFGEFRVIAMHYVRTWLAMDLLMVLPEWVVLYMRSSSLAGLSALRILKLSRMLRLLRALKMEHAVRKQLSRFNSLRVLNLLKLGQMMLGFLMLNHFVACTWYFIGRETGDGWLPQHNHSDDVAYGYTLALHWAISQFHGTSDVNPGNIPERIFAVSMQAAGLLALSIFLSATTNIILQERNSRKKHHERMENLRLYFLHHRVSSRLMLAVKRYFEKFVDEKEWVDDLDVLKGLPATLQKTVLYEARRPTVERHCLFAWLKEQQGPAFRSICYSAFYGLRFGAGTAIFETGDAWEKLIFVESGHLRYIPQDDPDASQSRTLRQSGFALTPIMHEHEGIRITKHMWLCELALWVQGWQSKGYLVSVSNTCSLCLDSATLAKDLNNFPSARLDVVMYVNGLLQEIATGGLKLCAADDLFMQP